MLQWDHSDAFEGARKVSVRHSLSPPCSQRNTICIRSTQQCGPRFWCQWEGAGEEGIEDACERIAEECGRGWQPKAYAILMVLRVRGGK